MPEEKKPTDKPTFDPLERIRRDNDFFRDLFRIDPSDRIEPPEPWEEGEESEEVNEDDEVSE